MPKLYDNLDFGQLQALNMQFQQLSADPGSPVEGQVWENTTTHLIKTVLNGSIVSFASGGGITNGFSVITDGSVSAAAIGSDTITFQTGNNRITVAAVNGGAGLDTFTWTLVEANIVHNNLSGLTTGDVHTQYVLLAGRAGGQTVKGGLNASDNLTLTSTNNATKGLVNVGLAVFNETSGLITANGKIQTVTDPTAAQDAATKNYVDLAVQGVFFEAASYATTAALPSCLYSNGALGVGATLTGTANGALAAQDGITPVAGDIILVKNQVSGFQNGLYVLTQLGTGGTPFILTRDTRLDTSAEFAGTTIVVETGTLNQASLWVCTTNAPTVGTTNISFTEMNRAADLVNGTGITISGNTISINTSWPGQVAITTVGALSAGSLAAGFTIVGLALGGTGVDSSSNGTSARDNTHLGKQTTAPATATNVTVTARGIPTVAEFTLTGTGAATAFTCTHNMGVKPMVQVFDSSGNAILVDIVVTTTAATITFAVAPANASTWTVICVG